MKIEDDFESLKTPILMKLVLIQLVYSLHLFTLKEEVVVSTYNLLRLHIICDYKL